MQFRQPREDWKDRAGVADLYTSTQAHPPIEGAPGLCICAQVSHDSSVTFSQN